jgi:hypothetical protein
LAFDGDGLGVMKQLIEELPHEGQDRRLTIDCITKRSRITNRNLKPAEWLQNHAVDSSRAQPP